MKTDLYNLLKGKFGINIIKPTHLPHRNLTDEEVQLVLNEKKDRITRYVGVIKYDLDTISIMEHENRDILTQNLYIEPKYKCMYHDNLRKIKRYYQEIETYKEDIKTLEDEIVDIMNSVRKNQPISTKQYGMHFINIRYDE